MLKGQKSPTAHKTQKKTPYGCNACFKLFESPSKLSRHYLIHTGQKPFRCRMCPKTFRQLVHRERHQQTHSLPFQCGICHRSYKNKVTFQKHQQTHSGISLVKLKLPKKSESVNQDRPASTPLLCIVCKKTFSTESRWVLHKCTVQSAPRASRGPTLEPQKCDFCSKPFPSHSKLERHILIHTGQRPFACHQCDKTFRQKAHLKIHQITHMEDKPFKCGFCQRSFKVQSKLVKHRQVHARKIQNQKVARKTKGASVALTSRLVAIDNDTFQEDNMFKPCDQDPGEICSVYVIPFQCPVCEQIFETQQILETHTCFIDEDGNVLNTGRMNRTHRPSYRRGKLLKHMKEAENGHLEMQFLPRKKGNSSLADRQPVTLQETRSIDPSFTVTRLTAAKRLVAKKVVGGKKIMHKTKSLTMAKYVQNEKFGCDMNIVFPCESLQDEHISGDREDVIYVSSADECDTSELCQNSFHGPPQRMRRRLKIINKCDPCQKTFPSLSKLRRHHLVHTGQKPFACAICGKMFRQSAHLKRHQVIHAENGVPLKILFSQAEFQNPNLPFSYQLDSMEFRSSSPGISSLRHLPDFDYDMVYSEPIAEIQVAVEEDSSM